METGIYPEWSAIIYDNICQNLRGRKYGSARLLNCAYTDGQRYCAIECPGGHIGAFLQIGHISFTILNRSVRGGLPFRCSARDSGCGAMSTNRDRMLVHAFSFADCHSNLAAAKLIIVDGQYVQGELIGTDLMCHQQLGASCLNSWFLPPRRNDRPALINVLTEPTARAEFQRSSDRSSPRQVSVHSGVFLGH
jgi:hypothetical protein